jgi:putative N-acetylmannosamine-6-phosphate epimerase
MADVVAADIYIVGAGSASISCFARGAEFVGLGISGYTSRWQRLFLSKRKKYRR